MRGRANAWILCVAFLPGAVSSQSGQSTWRNWVPTERYWTDVVEEVARALPQAKVRRFSLPVDGTIEQRALFFKNQISAWKDCPAPRPIFVVAHSQGGLDVRYAKRALKVQRIRQLVTVGTPHLGSELAEWAIQQRDSDSWSAKLMRWVGYDLKQVPFLDQLAPGYIDSHASAFAVESDFAKAGYVEADCETPHSCGVLFRLAHWITASHHPDGGDGLVAVRSQKWGTRISEVALDHQLEVLAGTSGRSQRMQMARDLILFLGDDDEKRL